MSKLKTLRSNLIVFSAVQKTDQLLAVRGRLYAKNSFSGRFVSWLCTFLFKQGNVENVIQESKTQFSAMMDRLEGFQKDFFSHESARLRGLPFEQAKLVQAEKEILYTCLLFRPLFKQWSNVQRGFLSDQLIPPEKEWGALCRKLRFIDQKRAYESITRQLLPLEHLVKAAFGTPLKVREEKELKRWVIRLKACEKVKVKGFRGKYQHGMALGYKLHRFFYDLYHHLLKPEKAAAMKGVPSLGALEAKLDGFGLNIADSKEAVRQDWIRGLAEGKKLSFEGKELVLGPEMTSDYEAQQGRRSFKVEGHDDVIFYKNEAGPYVDEFISHEEHFGIPLVRILSRKEKGGIAFKERITDRLDQIHWTSKSEMTQSDCDQARPIVELISLFNQLPYTPYPLETNAFGYNEKGEMRALRPMKQSAFFFEALEQFVHRIAQGNRAVFTYLMKKGSMDESAMAKEYRQFAAKALESIAFNEEIQLPKKHPEILMRYQLLARRLKECFQRESEKTSQTLSSTDLAIAIFRKYKTEGYASFLPENFSL